MTGGHSRTEYPPRLRGVAETSVSRSQTCRHHMCLRNTSVAGQRPVSTLKETWPGGAAEKRRIDGERDVIALAAAGGVREDDGGEASGSEGHAEAVTVAQVTESNTFVLQRHLALVRADKRSDRTVNRVLDRFLQQQDVRTPETIVVKTR